MNPDQPELLPPKSPAKELAARRSRYSLQSGRFIEWVDRMGLEQTFLGRWTYYLDQRFGVRKICFLFLFTLALAFLMNFNFDFVYTTYEVGERVPVDITSPLSFEMVDEITTLARKREAEKQIPPIFDFDQKAYDVLTNRVYKVFRQMRKSVSETRWPRDEDRRLRTIKDFLVHKEEFETALLKPAMPESLFEWLVQKQFNARLENSIIARLDFLSNHKIVDGLGFVDPGLIPAISIRSETANSKMVEQTIDTTRVVELRQIKELLTQYKGTDILPDLDKKNFVKLIEYLAVPNLMLNNLETEQRQKAARETVLPTRINIKKNQIIVKEGSLLQPEQAAILAEMQRLTSNQRKDMVSLATGVLFLIVVVTLFSYTRRFFVQTPMLELKDYLAMGTVLVMAVVLSKLFLFVSFSAFDEKLRAIVPTSSYLFILPTAAGTMLVALLIPFGEVVWIFTILQAMSISLLVDESFTFFIFSVVTGVAAARGVYKCRTRSAIYWAGLRTGAVGAVLVGALTVVLGMDSDNVLHLVTWHMSMAMMGGILSSLICMMIVPLFENVFNYTTDVKLLELSNLNHPLLKEMIVKAPGTYHHSLVVGSMVEAAAEEIGANPLLAKVSSYYHDIGKMEHSGYFIENQKPGINPHDHLSPNMSRTVLIAHVKDGVELGEKYKLGKPIIDVIGQHHGTTLISFFYHKAKEMEDSALYSVSEEEFRYPGPKPQIKEAALSMLADSIEAAARSLDEPTPVRLQTIVKNIIHSKFMDGQLDECDLTLKDLLLVELAFNRILMGIHHQRIDYPKMRTDHRSDEKDDEEKTPPEKSGSAKNSKGKASSG
ncbi:MAG: HD family phosphohydrolase [Bdellovibrionales bacterium]